MVEQTRLCRKCRRVIEWKLARTWVHCHSDSIWCSPGRSNDRAEPGSDLLPGGE